MCGQVVRFINSVLSARWKCKARSQLTLAPERPVFFHFRSTSSHDRTLLFELALPRNFISSLCHQNCASMLPLRWLTSPTSKTIIPPNAPHHMHETSSDAFSPQMRLSCARRRLIAPAHATVVHESTPKSRTEHLCASV